MTGEQDKKLDSEPITFRDFNFDYGLQDGLDAMGFREPTPIQKQAIPLILEGRDIIACAQTGTGKTAAYVLPVLNRIMTGPPSKLNTLILAPTRELAQQIDQQIEGLSYFISVGSLPIYGGGDGIAWEQQKRALQTGADVIVATPGRLIALIQMGDISFAGLKHLILDEADRMLDMGFYDDIMRIIKELPEDRQTLLFSATMPPKIKTLAKTILKNPAEVTIAIAKPAAGIRQLYYKVYEDQKNILVRNILNSREFESVIIFVNRKEGVKKLGDLLKRWGFSAEAFHSDLEQKMRENLLLEFTNREVKILVGTDILSRGIDVEGIDLVINYDSPSNPDDYVHRIGRTARAEATGTAITLVSPADWKKFLAIQDLIKKDVEQVPLPEEIRSAERREQGGGDRNTRRPGGNTGNRSSRGPSGPRREGGGDRNRGR